MCSCARILSFFSARAKALATASELLLRERVSEVSSSSWSFKWMSSCLCVHSLRAARCSRIWLNVFWSSVKMVVLFGLCLKVTLSVALEDGAELVAALGLDA